MNIHATGFRLIGRDQGPWPIDPKALNVFFFGGSTTLGLAAADDATFAALAQPMLRRRTGRQPV